MNYLQKKNNSPVRTYTKFLEIHKDQISFQIRNDPIGTKKLTYDILLYIIVHIDDTYYAELLLQKLLDMGIDPDIYTPGNHSMIFYATLHQRHELVKVLLKNGANPNVPTRNTILSNDNSPLEYMLNAPTYYFQDGKHRLRNNRLKIIQLLLDYGTYITNKSMLHQLKDEYIVNTTQNTVSDNIKFYLKYRKNITIADNTIVKNILQIKPPFSLQTLCKFTVVDDLKLNLRNLADNRIIPDCITVDRP